MNKVHFLNTIFKRENFREEEIALIISQFEKVAFKKNEYLIELGKVATYYYFLESGFARSYTIDTEGNDITTKFFSAEDIIIDWHSYFLKKPSRESIKAVTSCKWK